ncbi:hypothetical protein [Catelliglobosispora koreensis]|uniref:hypothetical protein n=1 Tax=Catelliglobosispora koreensis TaxID=129052 RepID=UPI0003651CCE|nr:hypothetical protein [Catelliglobosispora koreensis]
MTATTITPSRDALRPNVSLGQIFARTCTAEWSRLWSVKATWWFLAAAAFVMLALGTIAGFESAARPADLPSQPAWTEVRFIALPAQFALFSLAAISVTADYATGGIVPALQWTPRRTVLFFARFLVTVATATGAGVLVAVLAALTAFTTANSALTLQLNEFPGFVGTVAAVFAAGAAIAAGIGFVLRNTAGALVTLFLLMLVLPLVLRQFGTFTSAIAEILPGSGTIFLITRQVPGMTMTSSVMVLLAWGIGLALLGWLRLQRTDAHR